MNRPLAALLVVLASPLSAQGPAGPAAPVDAAATLPPYADTADLVLAAPVILDATVRSASRIKGADAAGLPAGMQRFYVEADVAALLRGPAGLPARVGYLVDLREDARGRVPKLRKARVLVFARPGGGSADQLQLVSPAAQVAWTPALDARVREIARAALAAGAAPAITAVGGAFHVPGSLPGEGETQIFLRTADQQPISLSVLRRPGERPRWSVSLGEIVDEGAAPPARDTLLWYRLACGLPAALPDAATAELAPADAAVAREDYRFVLESLGPCGRTNAVNAGAAPA